MRKHVKGLSGIGINTLFLIGYSVYILNQVFTESQLCDFYYIELILKFVRWALVPYFMLIIVMKKKYATEKMVGYFLVFAICALINMFLFDGKILVVTLSLIILASYKCEVEKILKTHVLSLIFGYGIVCIACLAGVLKDKQSDKVVNNLDNFIISTQGVRHTLGFLVPNQIPSAFLYTYLLVIVLKKDKFKIIYHIPVMVINTIIYYYFASRTVFLIIIMIMVLHCIAVKRKQLFIVVGSFACKIVLVAFSVISVLGPMAVNISNELVKKIDVMLSFRITLMKRALEMYPLTLGGYGEKFESITDPANYFVVDNGYLSLFIQRGIVLGILIVCAYFLLIKFAKEMENSFLLLAIFVISVHNCIDAIFLLYKSIPLYCILLNTANEKKSYKREEKSYV